MANDWFCRKCLENLYKHADVSITAQIMTILSFLARQKIALASLTIVFSEVKCNEHDSGKSTENIMPVGTKGCAGTIFSKNHLTRNAFSVL